MYYNKSKEEIEQELNITTEGLNNEEVKKRYEKYGKNILPTKKQKSIIEIFLSEFKDPMILLLLFASLVSILTGELIDALAIIFIILVDAIMGAYQENKANKSANALNNLVASKVKVRRNNTTIIIPAEDLTIGDYVILESGDKISADMRIIEAENLQIDESILTGESIHVHKNALIINKNTVLIADQTNMAFSGTTVIKGRGEGIVTGIGLNTEIGKIADNLNNSKEEKSPLTLRVEKLSKQISILIIFIAIIITILLLFKGVSYNEIFLSVIALAISAMPEGLPLALTMALTIASNKMAKQNVIVRKLKSAESLGSCTVIASDKTGTLTVNEQTAKKIILPNNEEYQITGSGYNKDGIIKGENINLAKEIAFLGTINNEAILSPENNIGDSIDIAFKILGQKLDINSPNIKIIKEIPYESENKYSALFYEYNNEIYCTVKGSLEVVKSFCKDINLVNDSIKGNLLEIQNENLAKDGYRVIALANGKIKKQDRYSIKDIKDLTFMGMVGFIDPVRKEVYNALLDCKKAGIKVLMITGDHPLTAYSIASELDMVKNINEVTDGEEIADFLKKDLQTFDNFIKTKKVFARVTPTEKLKIVESLKRQGEFVAVTGDGVNDAPALKAANIGVSMGSGTDIARENADMIITDDNFKSIVVGIKEGRIAYANIRKIILFLISCGLAEVLFFCLSILLNLPMPLVAIQLLWLNMVTDGIQDFALSFEKEEEDILNEPPRNPKESIFNKELIKEIIISGLTIGLLVFIVWYILINILNIKIDIARGYIMTLMVFIQNIHVFNCRSEKRSAFSIPLKSNYIIVFGIICTIILQIFIMEIPFLSRLLQATNIPILHLIYLLLTASLILIIIEIYKILKQKNKSLKK